MPPQPDTLGCHRPRIADRLVFDRLVLALVFSCAYYRIAGEAVSAPTLRRRDVWVAVGGQDRLERGIRHADGRLVALAFGDLSVDFCITKTPCGGELAGCSPADRGK